MRGFVQLQRIAEQVVPASMCAVRASQMNDLAVTVTIPCVQHAVDAV